MSFYQAQLLELPNYVKRQKKEKTFESRQELKDTGRFLIKLGSSVVTREDGQGVALPRLTSIVEQLAICHSKGIECCIVSSGAVAFGKKILLEELNKKGLPNTLNISQKRAAAAIGQPGLMSLYKTLFAQYNINVAQVLISNGSMGQQDARDIIKSTLSELLSLNIIPIINTNDAVNVPDSGRSDDVNLCDNDILAVALAAEINSDLVILATDVNGLYDKPPSEPGSKLISNFQPMKQTGIKFGGTSNIGTGGMDSKVKAATYALSRGVSPVICNGEEPNFITALLAGDSAPTSQPTRLFSFLNPLAIEIWLYVLAAYILVSFTLFVMARFSPYEWSNPHPCARESRLVTNQFSVSNSFWFITGTFLRQGSGLNPKATSTRIVGGIWWFFTLIIISSYTANLAAFLTVERTVAPIETVADLAGQAAIQYGTLSGGSTMSFFRDSKIDIYNKMWRYMESRRPSVFVSTYEEGVKRVLGGGYAFLMESTSLDHRVQRDCNLTQVGGLLDSKGYGIATAKGSPWRDKISLAILQLQEKGVVQILYDKWWKNTGDVCNREDKSKDSKANALGVQNIGGVFVVLLCGLALAILVAILEFCWNSKKNAAQGRQSLCSEMGQELRFAVRCGGGARQRPALRRHCARCSVPATYVPNAQYNGELTYGSGALPLKDLRSS